MTVHPLNFLQMLLQIVLLVTIGAPEAEGSRSIARISLIASSVSLWEQAHRPLGWPVPLDAPSCCPEPMPEPVKPPSPARR